MSLKDNEKKILQLLIEAVADKLRTDVAIENNEENWALLIEIQEDAIGKPFYEIPSADRLYAERPPEDCRRLFLSASSALRYLGRKAIRA